MPEEGAIGRDSTSRPAAMLMNGSLADSVTE